MSNVLTVQIDVAEPRIQYDRLGVLTTGSKESADGNINRVQWDMFHSNAGAQLDFITFTGYLTPAPASAAWQTSARTQFLIRQADTDKAASANWTEINSHKFTGDIYLQSLGVNEPVQTLATFEKNMPWWFSWFAHGQGDQFAQLKVILGNVGLEFYTDGTCRIYKPVAAFADFTVTNYRGEGNITKLDNDHIPISGTNVQGGAQTSIQDAPVDVLIFPWRKRELVIMSTRGGGFSFCFEDIDRDDPDPTITAAGKMQFYVPTGQATVQASPAKLRTGNWFATTGMFLSQVLELRQPPKTGAVAVAQAYFDLPGYDVAPTVAAKVVDYDTFADFVGNGVKTKCRLRVDMAGNGKNTPWLYGASAYFAAVTKNTDSAHAITLDSLITEANLSVTESPADVVLTLKTRDVATLGASVSQIKRVANRPIRAVIGTPPTDPTAATGIALLTGRTGSPKWHEAVRDSATHLTWECRDRWKSLEKYTILDPLPFDGRLLEDVIKELAMLPGYPSSDMDVEPFGFPLPSLGQTSKGEWSLIPEEGDSPATWLDRLWEDYAKTCVRGWYPSATGPKFRFRLPQEYGGSLSSTESLTIYETTAQAVSLGGRSAAEAYQYVYTSFEEDTLEIEANDIRVTGWDSRIDRAFQAHGEDANSKIPDTAPSARPENWLGEPRNVALFEPAITRQTEANYAAAVMGYRLMTSPRPSSWGSQMLFNGDGSPVWTGNVVKLYNKGRYRVLTVSIDFKFESSTANRAWRPATYTGRYLGA